MQAQGNCYLALGLYQLDHRPTAYKVGRPMRLGYNVFALMIDSQKPVSSTFFFFCLRLLHFLTKRPEPFPNRADQNQNLFVGVKKTYSANQN